MSKNKSAFFLNGVKHTSEFILKHIENFKKRFIKKQFIENYKLGIFYVDYIPLSRYSYSHIRYLSSHGLYADANSVAMRFIDGNYDIYIDILLDGSDETKQFLHELLQKTDLLSFLSTHKRAENDMYINERKLYKENLTEEDQLLIELGN